MAPHLFGHTNIGGDESEAEIQCLSACVMAEDMKAHGFDPNALEDSF